ncbi:MAG: hypothetical protein JXN64_14715 [Spirochaetes bacterium]|nr:hypothetical protein [Spirochaetota bacterium]
MRIFKALFNKKIIIGIHGLSNKVANSLLEEWWIKSIEEGLSYIGHADTPFAFKSVYWADILYEKPLNIKEKNRKSPLYEDEPYLPGDPREYTNFTPSTFKKKFLDAVERKIDKIFFDESNFINFDKIADLFIRHIYEDLDFYYNRESNLDKYSGQPVKDVIRKRLAEVLYKHRDKQILLVGHSMGSIIAYDVLTQTVPDVNIHTLITIGSPLGLPLIIKKIQTEQGLKNNTGRVPSPENIRHKWYNFSDLNDPVAIIYNISDDYKKNTNGVGPKDVIIFNNYKYNGKSNSHKLFGYLRAPEVARVIYDFCVSEKPELYAIIRKRIRALFKK